MRAAALALGLAAGVAGCSSSYVLSLGGAAAPDAEVDARPDGGAVGEAGASGANDAGAVRDAGGVACTDARAAACRDAGTSSPDAAPSPPGADCDGSTCTPSCRNDDDCPRAAPTCDGDLGFCIQCRSDSDCQESGAADRCIDHRCQP